MPELPEVESVVRGLRRDGAEGARIQGVQVLRPSSIRPQSPDDIDSLTRKQTILKVERRAKNILLHLSKERVIRVHLRMTGDLLIIEKGRRYPVGASFGNCPARSNWFSRIPCARARSCAVFGGMVRLGS